MPILDVQLVLPDGAVPEPGLAERVADAVARLLELPPGRVWVRLAVTSSLLYAENGVSTAERELPVFVRILHAHPQTGSALAAEARALTSVIAGVVGADSGRVHIEYAPPGHGRVAFGGILVQ